jgi:hypothetical protein
LLHLSAMKNYPFGRRPPTPWKIADHKTTIEQVQGHVSFG